LGSGGRAPVVMTALTSMVGGVEACAVLASGGFGAGGELEVLGVGGELFLSGHRSTFVGDVWTRVDLRSAEVPRGAPPRRRAVGDDRPYRRTRLNVTAKPLRESGNVRTDDLRIR
jgi:hypothetical protein